MNRLTLTFLLTIAVSFFSYSQTTTVDYLNVKSGNGKGLRFWNGSNSYEICEVGVYDMNGRLITRGVRVSDNDILIDVSSSQKGMFVVVIDGESSKSSKKIIYN